VEESDIIDLEKRYWLLKAQSRTGRFDLETFVPLVSPPIHGSLSEGNERLNRVNIGEGRLVLLGTACMHDAIGPKNVVCHAVVFFFLYCPKGMPGMTAGLQVDMRLSLT